MTNAQTLDPSSSNPLFSALDLARILAHDAANLMSNPVYLKFINTGVFYKVQIRCQWEPFLNGNEPDAEQEELTATPDVIHFITEPFGHQKQEWERFWLGTQKATLTTGQQFLFIMVNGLPQGWLIMLTEDNETLAEREILQAANQVYQELLVHSNTLVGEAEATPPMATDLECQSPESPNQSPPLKLTLTEILHNLIQDAATLLGTNLYLQVIDAAPEKDPTEISFNCYLNQPMIIDLEAKPENGNEDGFGMPSIPDPDVIKYVAGECSVNFFDRQPFGLQDAEWELFGLKSYKGRLQATGQEFAWISCNSIPCGFVGLLTERNQQRMRNMLFHMGNLEFQDRKNQIVELNAGSGTAERWS